MRQTIALLVLGSGAAFAFIFGNEADEFRPTDLAILLCGLVGILLAQSVALVAIDRILRRLGVGPRRDVVARILAALLVVSNAYVTAFSNYNASTAFQAALSIGLGAILLVVMSVRRFQPFTIFVLTAYFIMSLGLYAYTRIAMASQTYTSDTRMRVNSQRNVYLIGNESLQSPKAYREIYGINDLPHVDYLRRKGFRVLDSSYSADTHTLASFSRIMEFERPLDETDIKYRLAFQSENSTTRAFSESGYNIQFIYRNAYFAADREAFDFIYPSSAYFHCGFVPQVFFYGLCSPAIKIRINKYLLGTPHSLNLDVVDERIRISSASERPWLTFYHHSYPFHTVSAHDYRDEDASRTFRHSVERSVPRILDMGMERVVDAIVAQDPSAVIVLFGDHGAAVGRESDLDTGNALFTPAEVLEDRFGAMVAVYPRDFCRNRIFEGSTTTHLVENVIRCLNGDDRPTAEELAESRTVFWEDETRDVATLARLTSSAGRP